MKMIANLNKTVGGIIQLLQALAKYRESTIRTSLDPAIPLSKFDHQQISQLLLNLLNNAVEAHPKATIELTTSFHPDTNSALITLTDDGPGICEELTKKMFHEKFSTKSDGHGYGLPICRKIIENHNGSIQVRSKLGEGTTFLIRLPIEPI